MADHQGRSRNRRRLAIFGICLLPWLVVAGALLPGVVRVMAEVDPEGGETADASRSRPRIAPLPPGRSPWRDLPTPRDLLDEAPDDAGEIALEPFRVAQTELPAADPAGQWVEQLLTFPHRSGDVIAEDEVDRTRGEISIDDPILTGTLADSDLPPPSPDASPLTAQGDPTTLDDPLGPFGDDDELPVAIPEPRSAGLVGAGLAALALWRRAARRRAYFQPITS